MIEQRTALQQRWQQQSRLPVASTMSFYSCCCCCILFLISDATTKTTIMKTNAFQQPIMEAKSITRRTSLQMDTPVRQLQSTASSSSSPSPSSQLPSTVTSIANNNNNNKNDNDPNVQYIVMKPGSIPSDEWEMDCYSRPVIMADDNNKKLWQILITDSNGTFRYIHRLPSNQVNSKTLRNIVDNLIDMIDVKPNIIRFFRGAMFNMIQIALNDVPNVTSKPSRCTFALASWLEELYTTVYPRMEGFNKNMIQTSSSTSFLDVRTPIKLPDALRGEKYAFVSLPIQEFLPGGSISPDNIGVGRLCPIPTKLLSSLSSSAMDDEVDNGPAMIGADTFVQGVVILSSRATALAAWLAGTEVVALQADLRKRILTMETDIDNQYLMAKLNDQQRLEAVAFEEGKDMLQGLHFVSVQKTEDDDPEGFWLLRELPTGI